MLETCELYPGAEVYKPMLYLKTPKDASDLMKSGKYIAQPKRDGYFYQLVKTKTGEVYLFSRSSSKKTGFYAEKIDNVPHLKEWAQQLPNDTILIGEIYYPDGTSKTVTSIMGCLPTKAAQRQNGDYGLIHYYIHDILRWDGYDYVTNEISFEHRYGDLCEKVDLGLTNPVWLEIAHSKTGFDMEDIVASWMNNGEEGAVVKLKNGLYMPGKRTRENFKVKQHEDTLDFVIMDVLPPEKHYRGTDIEHWSYWVYEQTNIAGEVNHIRHTVSKENTKECYEHYMKKDWPILPVTKAYYYGWGNSFELGLYDGDHLMSIGRVASGFDDKLREDCGKNPQDYIGKVVEISCMSLDKENMTFRHPVLIQVRGDKPAGDCRLEDVFK